MLKRMIWAALVVLSLLFVAALVYYILVPTKVDPAALKYFSEKQIQLGRDYQDINRLLQVIGFIIKVLVLVWLLVGAATERWECWTLKVSGGNYIVSVLVFFVMIWLLLRLVNLPLSLYAGYYLQHHWGVSTQTLAGWWGDYVKGAVLDLILSGAGVALLFLAMKRWPGGWWLAAALFSAAWLVVQGYLWPAVVAPLFNRFEPVQDAEIITMVDRLGKKAGLNVSEILVMDASKRTTKANAYFAGIGNTKRIVLYDNLLHNYSREEIEAVVAHEMAHWKHKHIAKGIAFGSLDVFFAWFLLCLLLKNVPVLAGQGGYVPRAWVVILLFFVLFSFVTHPVQNGISRHMEYQADRTAVQLTENPEGSIKLLVSLARDNLADVSPPAFVEWFLYSHPSIIKRLQAIKAFTE